MIRFSDFDVLQYVTTCYTIKWAIENIPSGYVEKITIYRSESTGGPWEPIATGITGKEYYHDWTARKRNPNISIYYKLEGYVTDEGDPEDTKTIKNSETKQLMFQPDAVALEMVRRNNLVLELYSGMPCMVLIKKTWGPMCTSCYDESLNTSTSSKCKVCYNTKYIGGYYDPMLVYIEMHESGKSDKNYAGLRMAPDARRFWTTNVPELKMGDVFVDPSNTRWIIEDVDMQTARLGFIVRQLFTAVKVPSDDILSLYEVRNMKELKPVRDYHIWAEKSL